MDGHSKFVCPPLQQLRVLHTCSTLCTNNIINILRLLIILNTHYWAHTVRECLLECVYTTAAGTDNQCFASRTPQGCRSQEIKHGIPPFLVKHPSNASCCHDVMHSNAHFLTDIRINISMPQVYSKKVEALSLIMQNLWVGGGTEALWAGPAPSRPTHSGVRVAHGPLWSLKNVENLLIHWVTKKAGDTQQFMAALTREEFTGHVPMKNTTGGHPLVESTTYNKRDTLQAGCFFSPFFLPIVLHWQRPTRGCSGPSQQIYSPRTTSVFELLRKFVSYVVFLSVCRPWPCICVVVWLTKISAIKT